MAGILSEQHAFLLDLQQLDRDLPEWQDGNRAGRPGDLLTGSKLVRARECLSTRREQLSRPQQDFVALSIKRPTRPRPRRDGGGS